VKNGPVVIDSKSLMLALVNDAFFKYVGDIGLGNPKDAGKGAKYLIVHDRYKGEIPDGYIVLKTPTYRNWAPGRLTNVDAVAQFKETFKMYRLGEKSAIDFSGVKHNTIHANNEYFYHEFNEVIQFSMRVTKKYVKHGV